MTDQTVTVERAAAAYLAGALPDLPAAVIGDHSHDPDKYPAACYAAATMVTAAELGRQTVKLTLYGRTAVRVDTDRRRADALRAELLAIAARPDFAAALAPCCAVLPINEADYAVDDRFHTHSVSFNVFIKF